MANFLFCSAPLLGHLDFGGFLQTALHLRRSNHNVIWASGKEVEWLIRRERLPFFEVSAMGCQPRTPVCKNTSDTEYLSYRIQRSIELWLSTEQVISATKKLIGLCQSLGIDAILTDNCMPAAGLVAEILKLPLATVGYPQGALRQIKDTQVSPDVLLSYSQRLNHIRSALAMHSIPDLGSKWMFFYSPYMHTSFFPREWWYEADDAVPHQAKFFHVRRDSVHKKQGVINVRSHCEGRKSIFFTAGTVYTFNPKVIQTIFSTVTRELGCVCIFAGEIPGQKTDFDLGNNLIWLKWANFPDILPQVDLIIHHGGMGTTHASLLNQLPQLVIPQASDQFFHASRIEKFGLGIRITSDDTTTEYIIESINRLLTVDSYRQKISEFQTRLTELEGYEEVEDMFKRLASNRIRAVEEDLPDLPIAFNDYRA